jgi:hypothetical protein
LISNVKGRLEVLKNIFLYFTSDCNHNQISQWWQKTQPQMGPLWSFWFFHKKNFGKFVCNMFFKIFIIPPINYTICVNSFWINMNLKKLYRFSQILHFILKSDHNFKSCKKTLITLSFFFKLWTTTLIRCHTHYGPFTYGKWFLKFEHSKIRFRTFRIFKYCNFKIMNVFWKWMVGYHHFNFLSSNFLY